MEVKVNENLLIIGDSERKSELISDLRNWNLTTSSRCSVGRQVERPARLMQLLADGWVSGAFSDLLGVRTARDLNWKQKYEYEFWMILFLYILVTNKIQKFCIKIKQIFFRILINSNITKGLYHTSYNMCYSR